jgi:hypothetical protein
MNYRAPWAMSIDGRHLFDQDDPADVKLTVDGNWESDEQRVVYARALMTYLNRFGFEPPKTDSCK